MKEILKVAIPAIIALLGTLLTVFLGYRQWKRQQDAAREGSFLSQKQQTYKELWEKLENVHIRLRTEVVGRDEFRSLVRDVNSYILKTSLYLERHDQELANQYLLSVRKFTDFVEKCDSEDAKEAIEDTAVLPPSVTRAARHLDKLQTEVNEIRQEILERFRRVLKGNISKN